MYTTTARMSSTKRLTVLAALSAIAYAVMFVGRVPVVSFLKYDPKDVIIAFAGFIYGPLASAAMSIVVSLIEMVTVSDTGPIGLIMNILSTCAFACVAAGIYKKKKTMSGAVIGLATGVAAMVVVMLLWNYLITPLYMGLPRADVAAMLVPVFLPFNLLKGGLNATLTLMLYKPLVKALRASNMLPQREHQEAVKRSSTIGVLLVSAAVFATCVLVILVFQGIL